MRIALAQIISSKDTAANLALVTKYATQARAEGAELVIFPEATMRAFGNSLLDIAEPLGGPWAGAVRDLASDLALTIVVGMFTPSDDGRVRNTLLIATPSRTEHYDKIHLFDAFGFAESATVAPGDRIVTAPLGETVVGFATCYDIRFPALFLANAAAGATVNVVAASWGAGPGKLAQWQLLARARAVDTTTFVVAVGQGDPQIEPRGAAPTGIGHSLVVSPLGEILHELGAEQELLVVDLDLAQVAAARSALPVLQHRRTDLE